MKHGRSNVVFKASDIWLKLQHNHKQEQLHPRIVQLPPGMSGCMRRGVASSEYQDKTGVSAMSNSAACLYDKVQHDSIGELKNASRYCFVQQHPR